MAKPLFEQPILDSPYLIPTQHHAPDDDGQPIDQPPVQGRRRSALITPVPKAKKQRGRGTQADLGLGDGAGLSSAEQADTPTPIINEIRGHVAFRRALPDPADRGVTPATPRLLRHWRHDGDWHGPRPFFCRVEAVETAIWLTEVAGRQRRYARLIRHIEGANEGAGPGLPRLALKTASRLLAAADAGRVRFLRPLVELAVETGMRRGALLSLRRQQVGLDRRVTHLPVTKDGPSRDVPLSGRR